MAYRWILPNSQRRTVLKLSQNTQEEGSLPVHFSRPASPYLQNKVKALHIHKMKDRNRRIISTAIGQSFDKTQHTLMIKNNTTEQSGNRGNIPPVGPPQMKASLQQGRPPHSTKANHWWGGGAYLPVLFPKGLIPNIYLKNLTPRNKKANHPI